jgi:hypothetical protein
MPLPNRLWFTLHEAAARWGCSIADIAAWADAGMFRIITGIPPVSCKAEIVAGKVALAPMDLLPLFRRCGSGPTQWLIGRVQPAGRDEWVYITDPAGGMPVAVVDMLIASDDVQRFEETHNIFGGDTGRAGPGDESDYDWAAMNVEITRRVFEDGLPASQAEWIRELQDWFAARSEDGTFPDERSIRRRLKPILEALQFKRRMR